MNEVFAFTLEQADEALTNYLVNNQLMQFLPSASRNRIKTEVLRFLVSPEASKIRVARKADAA